MLEDFAVRRARVRVSAAASPMGDRNEQERLVEAQGVGLKEDEPARAFAANDERGLLAVGAR